jgi:hypothetical protein
MKSIARLALGLAPFVLAACSARGGQSSPGDAPDASAAQANTPSGIPRPAAGDARSADTLLAQAASLAKRGEAWLGNALGAPSQGLKSVPGGYVAAGRPETGVETGDIDVRWEADFGAGFDLGLGNIPRAKQRWTPLLAAHAQAESLDGRVVYRDAWPSTDAFAIAGARFTELALVVRDANGPHSFSWKVALPKMVAKTHLDKYGQLYFDDAKGDGILRLQAPWIVDANGEKRAAQLAWNDGTVTLSFDPAGLTYPILVDPTLDVPVWKQDSAALGLVGAPLVSLNGIAYAVGGLPHGSFTFSASIKQLNPGYKYGSGSGWAAPTISALASLPIAARVDATVVSLGETTGFAVAFGNGFAGALSDGSTYSATTNSWSAIPGLGSAGGRAQAAGLYIGYPFAVDGVNGTTAINELRRLDNGATTSWTTSSLTSRYGSASANYFISGWMVAGTSGSSAQSDAYRLDGDGAGFKTTALCAPCGFGARSAGEATYDKVRSRIVFTGGSTTGNDTWESTGYASFVGLCGTTTTPSCGPGFPAVTDGGFAYIAADNRSVLAGGSDAAGGDPATWAYYVRANTCSSDSQCDTGHCVDGVCCESTSCGTCQACNVASNPGICTNVPPGSTDPDSCTASTSTCNGSGSCLLNQGQPCTSNPQCLSGACTDGFCCNSATCTGPCDACSKAMGSTADGTCTQVTGSPGKTRCGALLCTGTSDMCPSGCTKDADCIAGDYCDGTGTCQTRKALGATCNLNADCKVAGCGECASGNCVEGVCCESACNGLCQACSKALKGTSVDDGKCGYRAASQPDKNGGCATSTTASCGTDGLCDGAGACQLYGKSTSCDSAPTCIAGNIATGKFCDGAGTCTTAGTMTKCDPYLCVSGKGCPPSCAVDSDCVSGYYCASGGTCQAKKPLGASCNLAAPSGDCKVAGCGECASGNCVEGICCESACNGLCQACSIKNKGGTVEDGKCGYQAIGTKDKNGGCTATAVSACGADGFCNGAGACELYKKGTSCDPAPTCLAGNLSTGKVCDGTGTCAAIGGSTKCDPYVCKSGSGCPASCTVDADCVSGNYCDASGTCQPQKALGASCNLTADCKASGCGECASGNCVDGVCCNSSCTGLCQACSATTKADGKADGQCGPSAAGQLDRAARCTDARATTPLSCGQTGACDGAGACALYGKTTSCATGSTCLPGNLASGQFCDGTGNCAAAGTTVDCALYVCKSGVGCPATCAKDTDCTTGNYCDTSSMTCQPKLAPGATCSSDHQCPDSNPYCVDHVCCNQPCDGQCESCTNKGACIPVVGDPVGGRTACAAAPAGMPCQAAQCDGIERKSCQGFATSATVCEMASCTGGKQTPEARCDGKGNCAMSTPVDCGAYACGATACKASCTADGDCNAPATCDTASGKCVAASTCESDGHTLKSPTGATTDCAPYNCNASGKCANPCASSADCIAPATCQSGACVSPTGSGTQSYGGGCSIGRGHEGDPSGRTTVGLGLAVTTLALARMRRRGAGSRRSRLAR